MLDRQSDILTPQFGAVCHTNLTALPEQAIRREWSAHKEWTAKDEAQAQTEIAAYTKAELEAAVIKYPETLDPGSIQKLQDEASRAVWKNAGLMTFNEAYAAWKEDRLKRLKANYPEAFFAEDSTEYATRDLTKAKAEEGPSISVEDKHHRDGRILTTLRIDTSKKPDRKVHVGHRGGRNGMKSSLKHFRS